MPAYVTLPGTSGNYFSTPDVNLLDADTAHLHQSVGVWVPNGSSGAPALSTAITPAIGDNHAAIGAGSSYPFARLGADSAGNGVAVTVGTQYQVSVKVSASVAGQVLLYGVYKTAAWANAATAVELKQAYTVNDWTTFTLDMGTAPATTTHLWVQILWYAADGTSAPSRSGTSFYFDEACIRSGSDSSFVKSLRIVNDIELEWKAALDDYTPTATNTILDCLNSNDGYRIRHTTGDLIEVAYGNGSSTRAQTSSATGLTDGEAHVFKVTVDQSTGAVVYYIDGVQHDTDTMTTGAGQPDINDLVVGANAAASANWTDGDIYYVIVRDGIDGIVTARFDADDWVGV